MSEEKNNEMLFETKCKNIVSNVIEFWLSASYTASYSVLDLLQVVKNCKLFVMANNIFSRINEAQTIYYTNKNEQDAQYRILSEHINDLGPLLCNYFSLTNNDLVMKVVVSYSTNFGIDDTEYFKGNRNHTDWIYSQVKEHPGDKDIVFLDYCKDLQLYYDKIGQDMFKIVTDFEIDFSKFNKLTTETRKDLIEFFDLLVLGYGDTAGLVLGRAGEKLARKITGDTKSDFKDVIGALANKGVDQKTILAVDAVRLYRNDGGHQKKSSLMPGNHRGRVFESGIEAIMALDELSNKPTQPMP